MLKNFQPDDWTTSFCLIFRELTKYNKISKKKDFSAAVGLATQSILNLILNGQRNFPIESRQLAMQVLRDHYHVNMTYFQSRDHPMFTQSMDDGGLPPVVTGQRGLTYGELARLHKLEQENEWLKKSLADKEKIIETQSVTIQQQTVLIHQLQGRKDSKKTADK